MSSLIDMRRFMLVALMTALVLSLYSGAGSATRLLLNESGLRTAWTPMRFVAESLSVSCNLTLEGSFSSRTITKTERARIGSISRAALASCTGGSATVLTETLPWQIQYRSFAGTLPNIASMTLRLVGAGMSITFAEFREVPCLGRTETNAPGIVIANRSEAGTITSMRLDETARIPLTGSFICELLGRGAFAGSSSSVTRPGEGGAISLTLVDEPPPSLSPSAVEFGRVELEAVVSRSVTVRAGKDTLEVRSITLRTGTSFAILDPNRCIGSRLAERSTCVFKTIFAAPTETGRTFEDTVSVGTNIQTLEATIRAST